MMNSLLKLECKCTIANGCTTRSFLINEVHEDNLPDTIKELKGRVINNIDISDLKKNGHVKEI